MPPAERPAVVMLSAYFPPSRYSVAKRPARFARHLRAAGWEPIVVSLPDGGGRGHDQTLLAALPEDLALDRGYAHGLLGRAWWWWDATKARHRGAPGPRHGYRLYDRLIGEPTARLTPVDRELPFSPGAARRAADLARAHRARVIYAVGCPSSTLLAGVLAGRLARLPVVLDLQDPWTLNPHYFPGKPAPLRALETLLEGICFADAARLVLNTEECRRAYAARYPDAAPRLEVIHNGFDRSMARAGAPLAYEGFALVHFGNLYVTRTLAPILRALAASGVAARVVCYGTVPPADRAEAERLGLADRLEVRPPVDLADAARALAGAGALLLLQPPDTRLQIPGKLYEYLASDRPILALSANPEIDAILARTGRGIGVDVRDEAAIGAAIGRLARGEWRPAPAPAEVDAFDAPAQARALARVLAAAARVSR